MPQTTVYILDDDRADRESLYALVSSAGFQVKAYASAEEFIEEYDGQSTGCVVTDYRMKDIDGLQLQKYILAKEWGLSVIILSGYADVPVTVQAMQHGALTLLEKPYNDQELLETISHGIRISVKWHRRRALLESIQQGVDSLTTNENEVLALLLKGLSNKQVAARLDMSLRTAERRRNAILKKMRVNNVTSVARQLTILEQLRASHPVHWGRTTPELNPQ